MQELMRLGQAADRLGVHVGTLRTWVREGKIPSYRVGGRFARVSWDEVLKALRTVDERDPDAGADGQDSSVSASPQKDAAIV